MYDDQIHGHDNRVTAIVGIGFGALITVAMIVVAAQTFYAHGVRHDLQPRGAVQLGQRLLVQADHGHVVAADDEQGGRPDARQGIPR